MYVNNDDKLKINTLNNNRHNIVLLLKMYLLTYISIKNWDSNIINHNSLVVIIIIETKIDII